MFVITCFHYYSSSHQKEEESGYVRLLGFYSSPALFMVIGVTCQIANRTGIVLMQACTHVLVINMFFHYYYTSYYQYSIN